jgi:hypothetical protein
MDVKPPNYNDPAWVVFCADSDVPWLKILKPGFRHCMVMWHDGQGWVCIDPLSHMLDIQMLGDGDLDMPAVMKAQGHVVIKTHRRNPKKIAPPDILSCVSIVKRALGIHRFFIVTPLQLYRYLMRERNARVFDTNSQPQPQPQPHPKAGDLSWEL